MQWLRASETATQLTVAAANLPRRVRVGDSVAVNGCCLTVAVRRDDSLTFDLLQETLDRTNLGRVRPDSRVNLEPALAAGDPMGGHFVQGHVDCTGCVVAVEEKGGDLRLEAGVPHEFAHYLAYKGSVAVNGVSLTVAECHDRGFVCWLIPHTRQQTNLDALRADDMVNLEFDILAKYVERLRIAAAA